MAKVMTFMGANANVDTRQRLTYVIYWRPGNTPAGHSAMIIDSSLIDASDPITLLQSLDDQSMDNYVSWLGNGGANPFASQGRVNTFRDDMQAGWGGQAAPGVGVIPTRWVALKGLDIHSMHLEWKQIRSKPNASWKLLDKNCATVVARVLKAGCLAVGAQGSWHTRNPLIWTPDGVMKFAKSLTNWVYASSST
jgi:hypothetical protein